MNASKNIFTNIAVANLYAEDSFNSAIVSQTVLWEKLYILKENESFYHVVCEDGYRGWIHKEQIHSYKVIRNENQMMLTKPIVRFYHDPNTQSAQVRQGIAGCRIPVVEKNNQWVKCRFPDGKVAWTKINSFQSNPVLSKLNLIEFAKFFLGVPYFWGGKTPWGFDCSGFVQFIHKMFGIEIRRDAAMQYDDAKFISNDYLEAQQGNLYFFLDNTKKINHVGICLGAGRVIHARGMVRINSLNKDDSNYDENLFASFKSVKRFFK